MGWECRSIRANASTAVFADVEAIRSSRQAVRSGPDAAHRRTQRRTLSSVRLTNLSGRSANNGRQARPLEIPGLTDLANAASVLGLPIRSAMERASAEFAEQTSWHRSETCVREVPH